MAKYRAKITGFIDNVRIRPGTVFELPPGYKKGAWMIPVDGNAKDDPKREVRRDATMATVQKAGGKTDDVI